MNCKPLLILTCGNPSRGDDALGSVIFDWIQENIGTDRAWSAVEAFTDFQLQVEHTLDMQGRARVLFVDASVSGTKPCELTNLSAYPDQSYTTHAMTPAAVLSAFETLFGQPPASDQLAVRGFRFELGSAMSPQAQANLEEAKSMISAWVRNSRQWAGGEISV